jgi:hypothetical protein
VNIIGPLIIGISLLAMGGRSWARVIKDVRFLIAMRSWPTSTATITRSRVKQEGPLDDPSFSHAYAPDIEFEYEVRGRVIHRKAFLDRDLDLEENVQQMVDRYPLFERVDIRYDPVDPGYAVLEPDLHLWKPIILGSLLLVAGLLITAGAIIMEIR